MADLDDDGDDDRWRTERQREWARWAASGYAKRYQPRSVLWFGFVFTVVLGVGVFLVYWLTLRGVR